jgi:hypothetical protein
VDRAGERVAGGSEPLAGGFERVDPCTHSLLRSTCSPDISNERVGVATRSPDSAGEQVEGATRSFEVSTGSVGARKCVRSEA